MSSDPGKSPSFAATRWSLVVAAGQRAGLGSEKALADLCTAYWYPLYVYVRRQVGDVHQAQDLTQQFFARVLEKDMLAVADPERGADDLSLLRAIA